MFAVTTTCGKSRVDMNHRISQATRPLLPTPCPLATAIWMAAWTSAPARIAALMSRMTSTCQTSGPVSLASGVPALPHGKA